MDIRQRVMLAAVCDVLLIYSTSAGFMRMEQAKIFPTNVDPPEETLELWMGKQALPVQNTEMASGSFCDIQNSLGDSSKRHLLHSLVNILDCLRCEHQVMFRKSLTDNCQKMRGNRKSQQARKTVKHYQQLVSNTKDKLENKLSEDNEKENKHYHTNNDIFIKNGNYRNTKQDIHWRGINRNQGRYQGNRDNGFLYTDKNQSILRHYLLAGVNSRVNRKVAQVPPNENVLSYGGRTGGNALRYIVSGKTHGVFAISQPYGGFLDASQQNHDQVPDPGKEDGIVPAIQRENLHLPGSQKDQVEIDNDNDNRSNQDLSYASETRQPSFPDTVSYPETSVRKDDWRLPYGGEDQDEFDGDSREMNALDADEKTRHQFPIRGKIQGILKSGVTNRKNKSYSGCSTLVQALFAGIRKAKRKHYRFVDDQMSGLPNTTPGYDIDNSLKHGSDHNRHIKKRYRIGLYDCISSYCAKLSGSDRRHCIFNYCHRSLIFNI